MTLFLRDQYGLESSDKVFGQFALDTLVFTIILCNYSLVDCTAEN